MWYGLGIDLRADIITLGLASLKPSKKPCSFCFVALAKPAAFIGFDVGLSKSQSTSPATMEFYDIINHYGQCWNSATNMFVAPITGLYSFQLTLMNPAGTSTTWAQLMHENRIVQKAYASGGGPHNIGVAAAVLKVNKGEHVYVRLMHGTAHSNGDHWTNFVGYLIAS